MRRGLAALWWLVWKDLRVEARGLGTVSAMVVAGVLFEVVVTMGSGVSRSGSGAATVVWAALLAAGVVGVERGMTAERDGGALAGVLLTPVDRGVVYLAKLAANLSLLGLAAVVLSVVGMVFLGLELRGSWWGFVGAMWLGLVGVGAVGTAFAGVVGGSGGMRGVLGLLMLPVCVPVVLASSRAAAAALDPGLVGPGWGVLLAFDVVYVVAGWLAFEHVVEA